MPFPDAKVTWTLDTAGQVSDEDLLSLNDGNLLRCIDMRSLNSRQLLRGHVTQPFNTALVTVMSLANDTIQFGQPDDPSSCSSSELPSHVMVHEGPTREGFPCQMFCSPPIPCTLIRTVGSNTGPEFIHDFTCTCPMGECKEILLWLNPNSSDGFWKFYEILVIPL